MVTVFPKPEPQPCTKTLESPNCPQLSLRAGLLTVGLIWKPHRGITWEIVSTLDNCLWLPCWNPETKISFIAFLKRELCWGGQKETVFGFSSVNLNQLEAVPTALGHSFTSTQHFLHPQVPVCSDPPEIILGKRIKDRKIRNGSVSLLPV